MMFTRDPLTEEMTPRIYQLPRSATHEHFSFPREYSPLKSDRLNRPLNSERTQPRNRPHSLHVKPVYGVSGSTVCAVHDEVIPPRRMSPLSNRDLTCRLVPVLNTRYSANSAKSEAAVGIIPVTYEWKSKFKTVDNSSNLSNVEPEVLETTKLPNLKTKQIKDVEVRSMLLGILSNAGSKGIRQEKLPNLLSYLAKTNRNSVVKKSKKTAFRDTNYFEKQLPTINHLDE